MKCFDYVKTAPICARILAVVTFILLFCSTVGLFILSCRAVNLGKELKENCEADIKCRNSDNFPVYKKFLGVTATMLVIALLSMIAWVMWILWYNFGFIEFLGSYIYYISIGIAILLLALGITFFALFGGAVFTPGDLFFLSITLLAGIICSLVLRFVYANKTGDDTPADDKAEA